MSRATTNLRKRLRVETQKNKRIKDIVMFALAGKSVFHFSVQLPNGEELSFNQCYVQDLHVGVVASKLKLRAVSRNTEKFS